MRNTFKVVSIALAALLALSTAACGGKSLNSPDALKAYLDSKPANTPDKPIKVTINANDQMLREISRIIEKTGKYVSLTLSGNALTTIQGFTFADSASLITSITIPDSVTRIQQNTFHGFIFTSITIPASVTIIEDNAFSWCRNLTSVTFAPTSKVTSIEDEAFVTCDSLTNITIPASVTSIGKWAFRSCTSLTSVTFATGSNITNFGNTVFPEGIYGYGGDTLKIAYATGKAGTYTRAANGDTWTKQVSNSGGGGGNSGTEGTSGDFAYTETKKAVTITKYNGAGGSVTIPAKINKKPVTGIGEGAFNECTSLASVTIPNGVTSIGNYAFSYCTSLASVTIPNSVTSIGDGAFNGCESLTSVTIPNGVTSIEDATFQNCFNLASVTIGSGVNSIGDYAFNCCTGLTSVNIPASVTSIGDSAFGTCISLASVTFAGAIPSSGFKSNAFSSIGDLRAKYLAANGGIGTYKTTAPTGNKSVWTKQGSNSGSEGTSGDFSYTDQNNFQATHKVVTNDGSNLRLRNNPAFNAAQTGSLEYGSLVKVLETGASAVDGDGNRGNWTYVTTPDGRTGWCFGAYLQSLPR